MAEYSEYLIQGETLDAAASTIRRYTPRKTEFIPTVEGSSGRIPYGSVSVHGCEWVDNADDEETDYAVDGDTIVTYSFLKNNEGTLVPVLYDTDLENYKEPDMLEPFFYEGVAEIEGEQYDKWRKIELGDNGEFKWDTQARYYIYTDVIVTDNGIVIDSGIDPEDFPQQIGEVYTTGYAEGRDAGIAVTNDATATAANIHVGKTAWVKGEKIEGTAQTYDTGYDEGLDEGYDEGYYDGEIYGYENGYDEGYADGCPRTITLNIDVKHRVQDQGSTIDVYLTYSSLDSNGQLVYEITNDETIDDGDNSIARYSIKYVPGTFVNVHTDDNNYEVKTSMSIATSDFGYEEKGFFIKQVPGLPTSLAVTCEITG